MDTPQLPKVSLDSPELVVEPPPAPTVSPLPKKRSFPTLLGVLLLMILMTGGAYYLGSRESSTPVIIQAYPSPTTTTENDLTVEPVSLANIKYTLPTGWSGQINDGTLLIGPDQGGGYFAIQTFAYDETAGSRETYCRLRQVCLEDSVFTELPIGNISGYQAENLDNSGGGIEYFGATGRQLYIITSYSPPSPSTFEEGRQSVLDSLSF